MHSKRRLTILGLSLAVTIIVSFSWAHAESVPKWTLSPTDEVGPGLPVEIATKAETSLALLSEIAKFKVEFNCKTLTPKASLEAEGKGSGALSFGGCITRLNGATAASCEPTSAGKEKGVITSTPLKAQLVLHEGSTTLLKVSAVTGETLATIEMSEECGIGEKVPVIGTIYLSDASGEFDSQKVTHALQEGPLTALWTISKTTEHKATSDGSVGVSLSGEHLGRLWAGSG